MAVEDDVNNKGDSGKKINGSFFDLNLSFGYSLYFHPNDIGGSPTVTIKLTSTKNYKIWSIAMTFALRNHNKHGFIDGSYKRDTDNLAVANYNNASVDVHSNGVSSNNATTNNFPISLSSKQLARLMNLLNDNGVSTANANMAGPKGKQDYRDRLGHPADQVLDALKTTLNLDIHSTSDHLCDTYDVNNKGDSGKKIIGSSFNLNLSFGYSLYFHPNDTGGSPTVTIKLTSTKNYKIWSIAMTFALRNHNKHGFIDGSYKRDTDNLAVTWILNSLSPNLFAGAIYAKLLMKCGMI
nr:hypothetical protein [Tanacetum cinerariifolium]